MEEHSEFDSFELQVNETAVEYLRSSAKWSQFLAIMGYIGIGLMVLAALAIFISGAALGSSMGSFGMFGAIQGILSGVYIVVALFYFFPVYYLYKYATDMKNALNERNNDLLTSSFGYLKSHHKFLGISVLVILSLYLLMIIGFVVLGVGSRF
jgi:hypothetical protein